MGVDYDYTVDGIWSISTLAANIYDFLYPFLDDQLKTRCVKLLYFPLTHLLPMNSILE